MRRHDCPGVSGTQTQTGTDRRRDTIPATLKKEQNLRSWGGFLKRLASIERSAGPRILFRGHGDSLWPLETTLERRGKNQMPVLDYFRLAGRIRSQVESFTGRTFEIPSFPELQKLLQGYDRFSHALSSGRFPGYSYLIYVRHHGFPSPLLDWTRSAYVAAYFAFAEKHDHVKKRSIYVWSEPKFRSLGTNQPELKRLGPYVTAHPRHVLQQCDYTVCPTYRTSERQWRFTSLDDALTDIKDECLWKFNIPSSERPKVLRFLDAFGLNAYSLFGSEESLMETIAIREFDLDTSAAAPPKASAARRGKAQSP